MIYTVHSLQKSTITIKVFKTSAYVNESLNLKHLRN